MNSYTLNKLADPKDFEKPEYKEIKRWCEAKVQECLKLKLPITYSAHFRAWEYAQMFLHIPFTKDSRILDLGTSESIRPIWYAEQGVKDYTTFDLAHKQERERLYGHFAPFIKVDVGDMHALPYEDSSFDIVLSISVVEHLADPKKALREMVRVVKPGGYIGLTTDFSDRPVPPPKSGVEFNEAKIQEIFIDTLLEAGCSMVGKRDFKNVDLDKAENRVVEGLYTFASLIFQHET